MQLVEGVAVKHFIQDRCLLNIEHFSIYEGQRIGIVGQNGCGKTTLLRIVAEELMPDEGQINITASVVYVPQFKEESRTKSGGEITQTYIQRALNRQAGVLLLDEPTTHLDQAHIQWLEQQLLQNRSAQLIVSHDRTFLNAVCTDIWEIANGQLTNYKGHYDDYLAQKEIEKRAQMAAFEKYKKEKQQLEEAIRKKEEKAQRATKKPKQLSGSEARAKGVKPYFANKQKKLRKTVSAFETRLKQLDEVEQPQQTQEIQMNIMNEEAIRGQIILRANNVSGHIQHKKLWNPVQFFIRSGEKVALIGANGAGKTTLLKKIVQRDEGITISPSIKMGYFTQHLSILDEQLTILENVSMHSTQDETLIRIVLARMHFQGDDVYKDVCVLSGGEKVKVALAKLFLSDANMLVLDEPTNYLDVIALEALEALLMNYKGTVIFASHDRMFIQNVATNIMDIKDEQLIHFDGTYEEYEAYQSIEEHDHHEAKRLLIDTKITDVLSRISIEPTASLEEEFQRLLLEKKQLDE